MPDERAFVLAFRILIKSGRSIVDASDYGSMLSLTHSWLLDDGLIRLR